jgi:hypothetical protein
VTARPDDGYAIGYRRLVFVDRRGRRRFVLATGSQFDVVGEPQLSHQPRKMRLRRG